MSKRKIKVRELYARIKIITEILNIEWGIGVKTSTEAKGIELKTEVPFLHQFISPVEVDGLEELKTFVARAKINELAQSDVFNIEIQAFNKSQNKFRPILLAIKDALCNYWVFTILEQDISSKYINAKIQNTKNIFNRLKKDDIRGIEWIKHYSILEKYNQIDKNIKKNKLEIAVLDNIKEYGSKIPSLEAVVGFYNAMEFQSEAVVVNKKTILIKTQKPANIV